MAERRTQREASDEWELVAANEVHTVDALKQEGNALFQQQRYFDAIQVYARALAQLPPIDTVRLTSADVESLEALEIAVRLNRALAYIELYDANLLVYAEEDCSVALKKQPNCVKAFYRRALARERLGKIKDALSDVERMCALESANPAALQLMARLQEAWSSECIQRQTVESELAAVLKQHCSVAKPASPRKEGKTAGDRLSAEAVWMALQDEEKRLRGEVLKQSASTKNGRHVKAIPATKKTPALSNGKLVTAVAQDHVRTKTDSLWTELMYEETSTVKRIYNNRAGATTRNKSAGKLNTNSAASIHPSP